MQGVTFRVIYLPAYVCLGEGICNLIVSLRHVLLEMHLFNGLKRSETCWKSKKYVISEVEPVQTWIDSKWPCITKGGGACGCATFEKTHKCTHTVTVTTQA